MILNGAIKLFEDEEMEDYKEMQNIYNEADFEKLALSKIKISE